MAAAFPLVFAAVVVYLHIVQPTYDPVHQVMSELALYVPFTALCRSVSEKKETGVSWTLGVAFIASVAMGSGIIPVGISQRLAALFMILWSAWAGLRLSAIDRNKGKQYDENRH